MKWELLRKSMEKSFPWAVVTNHYYSHFLSRSSGSSWKDQRNWFVCRSSDFVSFCSE